jgi:hypothetical protein
VLGAVLLAGRLQTKFSGPPQASAGHNPKGWLTVENTNGTASTATRAAELPSFLLPVWVCMGAGMHMFMVHTAGRSTL